MATYDLGTAHGRIEIDASSLGRASASLKFMGDRMLLLGGAAIAGFGFAVKAAADFEVQISRFGAVSDASEKQMEKVRQKALQLGRDSAFGAREVAEGFVEIAKAGYGVEELIAGVGDAAVYLAAAGELDMAAATDVLIVALKAFRLPASDAVRVADLLAGAANASLAEVRDLAESFKYAAPVAALLGVSLEDTTAMLAIFSNVGIQASTAGTSLRSILLGLGAETPRAAKVMKELGIITLDGANAMYDAQGALKPMPELWGILGQALSKVSPKERVAALNAIFLRRAIAAAAEAALQGTKGFEDMRREQEKTTAQEVMREKLDNLRGSLRKLGASLETFAITVGEHFQKPLQTAADGVRKLTNWFAKLDPRLQEAFGWALLSFGAFLLLGGVLFKIGQYTIMARRAFKDLALALRLVRTAGLEATAALTPLGLIVLAVLAIAVVTYFMYKNWDKVWKLVKDNPALAAVILLLATMLFPILSISFALAFLLRNWKAIWAKVKAVTQDVWDWLKGAAKTLEEAWRKTLAWFKGPFLDFWTTTLPNFLASLPGKFKVWAQRALDAFLGIFNNFPHKVGFVVGLVLGLLIRFSANLVVWAIQAATEVVRLFGEGLEKLIPFVIGLLADILLQFATWAVQLAENLPGWLQAAIEKTIEWSQKLLDVFITLGIDVLEQTGKWAMEFGPRIAEFLVELPGKFTQWAIDMLAGFLEGLGVGVGGIDDFFLNFPLRLYNALSGLWQGMWSAGWNAMNGLWEGLKALAEKVKDWVFDFAKSMVKKMLDPLDITSPSKVFFKIGQMTMLGLAEGLRRTAPLVLKELDTLGGIMAAGQWTHRGTGLPSGGYGGGGLRVDAKVVVVGASSAESGKIAGEAAAEAFSEGLMRRQLVTTARMV